jgi:hypothetical protein
MIFLRNDLMVSGDEIVISRALSTDSFNAPTCGARDRRKPAPTFAREFEVALEFESRFVISLELRVLSCE